MEIRAHYKTFQDDIVDAEHDLGVLLAAVVYGKLSERDVTAAGILYHMFGFDDDWIAIIAGCDMVKMESVQELAREELARQLVAGKWRLVPEDGE